MKKSPMVLIIVFTVVLFCSPVNATVVNYDLVDLGGNNFEYVYAIENDTLQVPVEQFTIWFGFALYSNLAIETLDPLTAEWDEIVLPPEPLLEDDGAYDAKALDLGIGVDETINGFSVSFDWLGTESPGSQYYEIIDPVTFETIDSGFTVPEPTILLYLVLGSGFFIRDRKKRK